MYKWQIRVLCKEAVLSITFIDINRRVLVCFFRTHHRDKFIPVLDSLLITIFDVCLPTLDTPER